MSGKIFVGNDNDIATLPNKIYVGVNNKARKVKSAYVGDSNGKAKQIWPVSYIPSIYSEVEYIMNAYTANDSSYTTPSIVFSNLVLSSYSRVIIDYAITPQGRNTGWNNNTQEYIFCVNSGSRRKTFSAGFESGYSDSGRIDVLVDYMERSGTDIAVSNYVTNDIRYVADFNRSGNNYCYINDNFIVSSSVPMPDTESTVYFFCQDAHNSYPGTLIQHLQYLKLKLYKCEIYNHDELVLNAIPCLRKTDYVVGLYDTVSRQFVYQPYYYAGPVVVH